MKRPCKNTPVGSTDDNVGDGVGNNIVNKCPWNVSILNHNFLCFNLKFQTIK
uniref:CCH-03 n=1 Tax=Bruguiera gymnorhiza TaxID=39984 RepID=Q4TV06_BRUGY|nr:CCH-03 [Bruguiera gymnorhiza]